jgi:hypothetical protein
MENKTVQEIQEELKKKIEAGEFDNSFSGSQEKSGGKQPPPPLMEEDNAEELK